MLEWRIACLVMRFPGKIALPTAGNLPTHSFTASHKHSTNELTIYLAHVSTVFSERPLVVLWFLSIWFLC